MSVHVKDGTPLHGPSLCESCVNAHIQRGFSEVEQQVICGFTWPNHAVNFRVRTCTDYVEVKRQTLKQMEDMAWILMPREGKRVAGFVRPGDIATEHQIEIELDKTNRLSPVRIAAKHGETGLEARGGAGPAPRGVR